jgi:hypothetical protein
MSSMTTTRRAMLAGAAALPALGAPGSLAAAPDPIFAAIERYRKAYADEGAAIDAECELANLLPEDRSTWSWHVSETRPPEGTQDAPEWIEVQLAQMRTGIEVGRAYARLVETVPTTAAGLVALTNFIKSEQEAGRGLDCSVWTGEVDENGEALYANFTDKLFDIIGQAANLLDCSVC